MDKKVVNFALWQLIINNKKNKDKEVMFKIYLIIFVTYFAFLLGMHVQCTKIHCVNFVWAVC